MLHPIRKPSITELFVRMFRELRAQTGDKPNADFIRARIHNDANFGTVAQRFDLIVRMLKDLIDQSPQKGLQAVYDDFPAEWKKFNDEWSDWSGEYLIALLEEDGLSFETEVDIAPKIAEDSATLSLDNWMEFRDIDLGIDSPAELIEAAEEYLRDHAESAGTGGFERWAQSIEWFAHRLNLKMFEIRWRKLPEILVPKRVSDRHDLTGKSGLFLVLDEARKAYLCGCNGAALAMLRALTEEIIDKHYIPKSKTPRGYEWNAKIQEVIKDCERLFPTAFKGRDIWSKIKLANELMHSAKIELPRQWNNAETPILNWIKALKEIIELAPPRCDKVQ